MRILSSTPAAAAGFGFSEEGDWGWDIDGCKEILDAARAQMVERTAPASSSEKR